MGVNLAYRQRLLCSCQNKVWASRPECEGNQREKRQRSFMQKCFVFLTLFWGIRGCEEWPRVCLACPWQEETSVFRAWWNGVGEWKRNRVGVRSEEWQGYGGGIHWYPDPTVRLWNTGIASTLADGLFLLSLVQGAERVPIASGRGGNSFPRSTLDEGLSCYPFFSNQALPRRVVSHFSGRMISERILQVGIFSYEVGRSHVPVVTAPFVFCRVTRKQGSPVAIRVGSQAALGHICCCKGF